MKNECSHFHQKDCDVVCFQSIRLEDAEGNDEGEGKVEVGGNDKVMAEGKGAGGEDPVDDPPPASQDDSDVADHSDFASAVKVGDIVQAFFDRSWHRDCKVVKVRGKHQWVATPNVLGSQSGCKLMPSDAENPDERLARVARLEKDMNMEEREEDNVQDCAFENVCVQEDESEEEEEDAEEDEEPEVNRNKKRKRKERKKRSKSDAFKSLLPSPKRSRQNDAGKDEGETPSNESGAKGSAADKVPSRAELRKAERWSKKWCSKHCMKVISEEGNNLFRCKCCDTELKSTATWTSTPMANHLRRIHQITKETVPAATTTGSQTPVKAGESVTKFPPGDMRHALLHRSSKDKAGDLNELAILVVTDLCPSSIVDGKGFRAHQSCMSGGTIASVSRTAGSRHIMAKATRAREMLKKRMQGSRERERTERVHACVVGDEDAHARRARKTTEIAQCSLHKRRMGGPTAEWPLQLHPSRDIGRLHPPQSTRRRDTGAVTGRHTGEHLHQFLKKKRRNSEWTCAL